MNERDLLARTNQFAIRVIQLVAALPNTIAGRKVGDQLLRACTSVGANYRAACRGRSKVELIMESGLLAVAKVSALHDEAQQIARIMARSRLTAVRAESNRKSQIANRK